MKKTILSITIAAFMAPTLFSQDNCSQYYPMIEGSSFQYTMTNKKGKAEGVTDYNITKVENSGGGTKATMNMKLTDEKGKEIYVSDFSMTCIGNGVKVDYNSLVPSQMLKQYEDMGLEMDITGTDIDLPNNLDVGQELPDANVSVAIKMMGMNMSIKVDQVNRKVEKKESVTTAAGTFECYLLTEDQLTETMGRQTATRSKLWLAEGVGMVKQETYKKNGDLTSKMELTKYSK